MKTYILQKPISCPQAGIWEGAEFKEDGDNYSYRGYTIPKWVVEGDHGTWFKLKEEVGELFAKKPRIASIYESKDGSTCTCAVGNIDVLIANAVLDVVIKNDRLAEILIAESKGEVMLSADERNEYLVSIMRDAVSETWGHASYDYTQKKFNEFLIKRGFITDTKNPNEIVNKLVDKILLDKKQFTEEDIVVGMRLIETLDIGSNTYTITYISLGTVGLDCGALVSKKEIVEKLNNGTFKIAQ